MTDLHVKQRAAGKVLARQQDRWQRLDAVCLAETVRLLVHCLEESHFHTFLSHLDIAKQLFQRSAVNRREVAHRSGSYDSSLRQLDDQGSQ